MAGLYNEDESTDDEFFVNLHLAEKLRINRSDTGNFAEDKKFENSKDYKQYCNIRRKKFAQEGQSSSSSSLEAQNDNPGSGFMSSDSYHNKKRQNGDKSTEQLANPKRTCLSDRFHRSPDWRDLRKKASICEPHPEKSIFPEALYLQSSTSSSLFSDSHREGHGNGVADPEDSDFEVPMRMNMNVKKESGQSKSKMQSSASNNVPVQGFESKPSTSYFKILDSGSEDESKSIMQNGALKGGRQDSVPDSSYYKKLFSGRKVNRKILDSDESEEDINPMVKYRSKPLVFSSSDSEDFTQNSSISKHNSAITNGSATNSNSYSNGFDENDGFYPKQLKSFRSIQKSSKKPFGSSNRAESSEGCDRHFLSSDFSRKNMSHRHCKSRRSPRNNMQSNLSNLPTTSFNGSSSVSAPVPGRRMNASERGARRSGSPHHRSHRCQHKPDDSKRPTRSASASQRQKDKPMFITRYPDVFDPEESENEFFTANSYSDTETSTESFGGLTANSNGSVTCTSKSVDRLFVDDATTDDEISIVFSTGPVPARGNEPRRGVLRTLGRRHIRGTPHRTSQSPREIVSLSPDPVEQVRQMEEDERMAIMLQAQFDAEVDHNYTASPDVSQNSIITNAADSDDEIIDPLGDSDSDESSDRSVFPYVFSMHRRGHGLNRFTSNRPGQSPLFFGSRRPDNRRRRTRYRASSRERIAESQINFGLFGFGGMPSLGASFLDDYEVLLSLDIDDDAAPRGLSKGEISRLPTRSYIHPNALTSSSSSAEAVHKRTELNKECQVCLMDYEMGDVLRILPCFHEFHTPCIDPWLTINQTCPVCRVTVDLDG